MTDRIAEHLRALLIKGRENSHGSLVITLDRQTWKRSIALLGEHHDSQLRRGKDFDAMPLGLA